VKRGQNSYAGELSNLPKSLEKASILVAEDKCLSTNLNKNSNQWM